MTDKILIEGSLEGALAAIWTRSRPLVLARVRAIELAAAELGREPSRLERIEAGRSEAHKLAGVLGTFGLDRGTELARELETQLADPAADDRAAIERLAAELRATVVAARA